MKHLFLLLLVASFSLSAVGQIEEKMKKENVVTGVLIKNGKEIEGYIKKKTKVYTNEKWFDAPWTFQNGIKFIEKDVFENTEKIKNKNYVSYSPKDCDGYRYDNDSLIFDAVKYADMSAVGTGMIPKLMFLRKVADGKISLYFHYATPPNVVTGGESIEQYYIECNEPKTVYRKGTDGKLKLVTHLNIEKELADCPSVVEKHKNGEYNLIGEENTKFNRFLNNSSDGIRENLRFAVIEDYNTNCE